MKKIISNSGTINAVINGKSLTCKIRRINDVDFFQFLDNSTSTVSPSWKDAGPKFYAEVTDSEGKSYVLGSDSLANVNLYWNGGSGNSALMTFDSNNLNTNILPAGTIRRSLASVKYSDGNTYQNVPVFEIIKDVFGSANADSDDFYVTGQVTLEGANTQDVRSNTETVQCVQTVNGGNTYVVRISSEAGKGDIDSEGNAAELVAKVYKYGATTEVTSDASLQWADASAGTESNISSATTSKLTVSADMVNGDGLFVCIATIGGKAYRGYYRVKDYSDPYHIEVTESGTFASGSGTHIDQKIQAGETVTRTAHVVKSDGTEVTGTKYDFTWVLKKADGTTFDPTTENGSVSGAAWKYTYAGIIAAGGSVNWYLSAEPANS